MNKFIVFDLDGTIINSLPAITIACNEHLENLNKNYRVKEEDVRKMIGNGSIVLYRKLMRLNDDEEINQREYFEYLKLYKKDQHLSSLYEKVYETVLELDKLGYKMFIVSNKPNMLLDELLNNQLKGLPFVNVYGKLDNYPTKPNPKLINELIINKFGFKVEDGYYVGDSLVDYQTAKNANLKSIILTYGYCDYSLFNAIKDVKMIDHFDDLLEVLK